MRLYRLHYYHEEMGSQGFRWFASKRAAESEARAWVKECDGEETAKPEVQAITIARPSKRTLLALLNDVASHSDNG